MEPKIVREFHQAARHRSQQTPRIALVLITVAVLLSGCENSNDARQSASIASSATTTIASAAVPKQFVDSSKPTRETSRVSYLQSATADGIATITNIDTEAEQLRTSRLLRHADRTSSTFKVIGPHTKNVVALYQFFDSAGWNDFLDGLTLKSCPEQYEFFCQIRGVMMEFFDKSGGDVSTVVQLARNMDLREHFYHLASAADMYAPQYQQYSRQVESN